VSVGVGVSASDVLRDVAARDPGRLALEVGDDRVTYGELDAMSTSVAHALLERLGTDRHNVVLSIEGTKAFLVASLALWRAGLASVPVDPTAPADLLQRICAEVDAPLILSDQAALDGAGVEAIDPLQLVGEPPSDWKDAPLGEYVGIAFTSGSTGEPKGIMITPPQRNVFAMFTDTFVGAPEDVERRGVVSTGSNHFTEAGLYTVLAIGDSIVACDLRRVGLPGCVDWLRGANIVSFGAVPTLLRHLLPALGEDAALGGTTIYLLGEAPSWEDVALARRHFSPEVEIANVFASSEGGVMLRYLAGGEVPLGQGTLPLGEPLPGRTVELVDDEGQPVPDGDVGEIVVTGRETALGYWKRPDETAQVFLDLGGGVRRVRTGDLGRLLPDGSIEYRGRADHLVKIAGNRVELGQIEATLRMLDGVAGAVARTYTDEAGDLRLTAAVVAFDGHVLHPSVLRLELARRLPAAMLPDGIAVLDSLPRLPGGKVDRESIPVTRTLPREPAAPPATDLERRILRRWQDVLGIDDLGVEDDFFSVGGDSLRGASIIIGLNDELGTDLAVSVLVEASTVRQLAAVLEAGTEWSPLVTARSEGDDPPLFVVHDVGGEVVYTRQLAALLPEGFPIYGLQGQALEGRMIPEHSLEELASRYVTAVRAVWPSGPYRFYGSSAGGTIAFEMARQLRRAGAEVPVLVLGDTLPPGTPMKWGRRERAAARLRELRAMPVGAASGHVLRIAARQAAFAAHRATARVTRSDRGERAYRTSSNELLEAARLGGPPVPLDLRNSFAVLVYGWMAVAYTPETPYDGPVTVLTCAASSVHVAGWDGFLTTPFREVPIGASHLDLGTEAGVREVAAALTVELGPPA